MDWLIAAGLAFAAIAPVELPDKTFVATLVLATRFRPIPVWLGVVSAFALHTAVAVFAGSVVGLLPELPVRLAAAGLFAVGAVLLWRGARQPAREDAGDREQEREYAGKVRTGKTSSFAAYGASFLLLFTAEWGDLSQIFTAGLVASGEPAAAVFVGAWAALAVVSGSAVVLGRRLLRHVRLSTIRYVAATVCATISAFILVTALV